jgi:two-component system sensor kinase FixL
VSHELRNPLGVIRNSVYYLKMVLPDDERTRKRSIRVKKALAESLAPVMVDADHIRLLLGNLVSNAIQTIPDGVVLTVESRSLEGGGELIVEDTGMGIPPGHLERIFEPLFTTKSKGIGLGLSLAKRLAESAESNDGRIRVVSAPGGGSCFTVELSSLQGGRG